MFGTVQSRGFSRAAAALLAALLTLGAAQAAELLVLEKGSNTLAIVDLVTLQVIARVPSGPDPHEVIAAATAAAPTSPITAVKAAVSTTSRSWT